MSSNITIVRVCEHCGDDFTAKTTVTRFCSDVCRKRNYKKRLREGKIAQSNTETHEKKEKFLKKAKDLSGLEYLNPSDAAKLLQCSRVYVYKLLDSGRLSYIQLSEKKRLISRRDLNAYLATLAMNSQVTVREPKEVSFDMAGSFSMAEAQEYYKVSEKGLYDLIKRNNIRKMKRGKYVFVEKIELDKYLK